MHKITKKSNINYYINLIKEGKILHITENIFSDDWEFMDATYYLFFLKKWKIHYLVRGLYTPIASNFIISEEQLKTYLWILRNLINNWNIAITERINTLKK